MDERTLKRLLVIVAVSIIAILTFKSMMLKSVTSLVKLAEEKKQTAATNFVQLMDTTPVSDVANAIEMPATSAPGEASTLELQAASGVGEGR